MLIWFLLAVGSAITNSWLQVTQKWAVLMSRYSKLTIVFIAAGINSVLLFVISYIIGFPNIDSRFWTAILITGVLNAIASPIMLKAYEIGEFSSVYSMILTTPVFLLLTSFVFLGEVSSVFGILGVLFTVLGLWIITRSKHEHVQVPNFSRGNWLGILVALIYSITVNFDKLGAVYSSPVFSAAAGAGIASLGNLVFLLVRYKRVFVKTEPEPAINHKFPIQGILLILLVGFVMALGSVLHNSALLTGFASYTIAIKRTGVLFGVFWGWLFFHEKNIAKKIFGAAVAVAGVLLILFLG